MLNTRTYPGITCIVSFLTGILMGSGIALAIAPRNRNELRAQLRGLSKGSSDDLQCGTDDKRRIDEAAKKIHDYYEEARRISPDREKTGSELL